MEFKKYLGTTKRISGTPENIYLTGFKWECDWYWGGGYLGNSQMHTHFSSCFLNSVDIRGHSLGNFCTPWNEREGYTTVSNGCSIWEPLSFFLDDAQYSDKQWWRIKDLYKQFYAFKEAAEAFILGGHCTSHKRNPEEINKEHAALINKHIELVVIPLIIEALDLTIDKEFSNETVSLS